MNFGKISIYILICFIINYLLIKPAFAGPTSTSYQLIDYGFGSGGIATSSSTSYMLQGIAGEIETASLSSASYMALPGLTYTLLPNTPPTPTFTNPSNYYNKLQLVINQGGNTTDTTYAISLSTDNFVSNILYVQADNTLGANPVWQLYSNWGISSVVTIIGLTPGTTYYARVAASRGTFSQGIYGAVATANTVNPTFTFGLQTTNQAAPPFTVGIGVVTAGQVTTSWQKIIATISTNANNGGTVYINDVNSGLLSAQAGNHTIAAVQNDLSSAGVTEGYGARGVSVSQTLGTMELISPYNLGGNNVGIIDTSKRPIADSSSAPISNGTVNFELKAKASSTTPAAADYADTITVVASGGF